MSEQQKNYILIFVTFILMFVMLFLGFMSHKTTVTKMERESNYKPVKLLTLTQNGDLILDKELQNYSISNNAISTSEYEYVYNRENINIIYHKDLKPISLLPKSKLNSVHQYLVSTNANTGKKALVIYTKEGVPLLAFTNDNIEKINSKEFNIGDSKVYIKQGEFISEILTF